MQIRRQYIVDEQDQRIAVQVDIETFEKIEETLENFALFSMMKETDNDEVLDINEAKLAYAELEKA
ncbi:MAG: hypothetical protein ACKVRN_05095 [Pyrinomonadaceae bacterium]